MEVNKIAVIGSGVMGRGIAYTFAINNFQVAVNDINNNVLRQAQENIDDLLSGSLEKGFISQEKFAQAKQNLVFSTDLEAAAKDCGLVIEAVLENIDLKIDIFQRLDKVCSANTIFATNTSTMSPTEIAAQISRPDRFVAMHFFNPVHKMKLIEVIKGLETSANTLLRVQKIAGLINKTVVEVNEFPGFVTSRMNCLIGNEAMNLLMEGVASAKDIDIAMKLGLNHPMGPLELADLVGLDTRLRNMQYLHSTLGEKYRPCPLLVKYVKAGRLGRKSGQGFYDYSNK